MVNYSNTCIYKLYCLDNDVKDIYIGYTTNIKGRIDVHRRVCLYDTHKSHNQKTYRIIRQYGGWDNWTYEIIERFTCNTKEEAKEKERYYIRVLNPSMNTLRN